MNVFETNISVASDGTNQFAVWTSSRGTGFHLYGTRLDAAGHVLDPDNIQITTGDDLESTPAVTFDGTDYLVVWWQHGSGHDGEIRGARVGTDGTVKDTTPFVVSAGDGDRLRPRVAWNGTTALIVWQDRRSGFADVYGSRWTPAGGVLDPNGIAIADGDGIQHPGDVVAYGSNFLVSWVGDDQIRLNRVEPDGDVLDGDGVALIAAPGANVLDDPSMAFDGTNVLVTYSNNPDAEVPSTIRGARWSPTAGVLDPSGFPISNGPVAAFIPEVAFVRGQYLVVFDDGRNDRRGSDVYAARVKTDGTVLDPDGVPVATAAGYEANPAVTKTSDGRWLVVYERNQHAKYRTVGSPK